MPIDLFAIDTLPHGSPWGLKTLQDPLIWTDPPPNVIDCLRRRAVGSKPDARLVSVVGPLTSRKRISELVNTWATMMADEYVLVLAGQPDSATAALLRSAKVRALVDAGTLVLWTTKYHSDLQLDALIAASDALCLLYQNTGSSGFFLKAIAARTPVISSWNPLVARVVAKHNLGTVVHRYDPKSIAAAIRFAVQTTPPASNLRAQLMTSSNQFVSVLCES